MKNSIRECHGEGIAAYYEKKDISMSRFKKGFRRFAAAALCAVLVLSAAGCGGGGKGEQAGSGSGGGSAGKAEVQVVTGSIDEQAKTVQELQKAWRAAADDDSRRRIKQEIDEAQYALDLMTGKEKFDPSKVVPIQDLTGRTPTDDLSKAAEIQAGTRKER